MTAKRFAVFDRDGTLIVERNYLSDPAQVELIPGTAQAFRKLIDMGIGLAVVTNQSGIGRGYFTEEQLHAVHHRMAELLAIEGAALPPVYWCPHRPDDGCVCRKPLPGLLERASKELGFAPSECFVIGDKVCDVELGRRVGATTILVRTGYGKELLQAGDVSADYVAADIVEASNLIIASFLQEHGAAALCSPTVYQQPARVA